ncbi:MAG TPA: hypothetical protein VGC41_09010, partial [Kofleriaceae bacterium]
MIRTAEIGAQEGSHACLVGTPPRVLVLGPDGGLHVVDPIAKDGPVELSQMNLPAGSRFLASSELYVLLSSPAGPILVELDDPPSFARFPSRSTGLEVASALKQGHFVVQVAGVLEEWSGPSRAPARRFRLDRAVNAQFLGGGAKYLWFVTRDQPSTLVVVSLLGSGPPAKIELDEPVATACGDRSGQHVAIVGTKSRSIFLVSLSTKTIMPLGSPETIDIAWRGVHELVRVTSGQVELITVPKPSGT